MVGRDLRSACGDWQVDQRRGTARTFGVSRWHHVRARLPLIDLVVRIIGTGSRLSTFNQRLGRDRLSDNMLTVFEQPRLLATVKTTALEVEGGLGATWWFAARVAHFTSSRWIIRWPPSRSTKPMGSSRRAYRRRLSPNSSAMWRMPPIWRG